MEGQSLKKRKKRLEQDLEFRISDKTHHPKTSDRLVTSYINAD
jgi:hypothetical protein